MTTVVCKDLSPDKLVALNGIKIGECFYDKHNGLCMRVQTGFYPCSAVSVVDGRLCAIDSSVLVKPIKANLHHEPL